MALTSHSGKNGGRIVDYLEITRRAAETAAVDKGDLGVNLQGRAIEL
jgi:hypothetical protein